MSRCRKGYPWTVVVKQGAEPLEKHTWHKILLFRIHQRVMTFFKMFAQTVSVKLN